MRYPLLAASFALTGYAGVRLLGGRDPGDVVLWVVGAAVLHDLVLLPLYALFDRGALRLFGRELINYVRVPAFLSGLLLLVHLPLIVVRPARYEGATGLPADVFPVRWLLLTAALFTASAGWLVLRRTVARRRPIRRPRSTR